MRTRELISVAKASIFVVSVEVIASQNRPMIASHTFGTEKFLMDS
jgi:hypothetical protein